MRDRGKEVLHARNDRIDGGRSGERFFQALLGGHEVAAVKGNESFNREHVGGAIL
ncbi:MAG: hypothetical protein K0S65_733 [Labilithrix sp.]|nr:hypothetical protein [Labilithrix sp.]